MKIRIKPGKENLIIFKYTKGGSLLPTTQGAYHKCMAILERSGQTKLEEVLEKFISKHYQGHGVEFWVYMGQVFLEWNSLASLLVKEGNAIEIEG